MRTKCVATFLSTRVDTNGNQLSEDILHDVVDKQPQVPVIVDFSERSVGSTVRYNFGGNIVFCEFEVDDEITKHALFDRLYLVPIFTVLEMHRDGRNNIVDDATLTTAMLTYLPANPAMNTVKPLKGDEK